MMELVRLCVNVNAKRDSQQLLTSSGSGKEMFSSQRKERIFIDFDLNYFWQWTDFQSYVEAVASFLAGGSLLNSLLIFCINNSLPRIYTADSHKYHIYFR